MTHWRRDLPDFVEYSPDTIYARLDSNQLGGLMLIHSTYHHNYLTLYKISMPELFCLNSAPIFPYEHRESLQALQAEAYFHARQIARLLAEAAEHGTRLLSDSVLPFFAYDSSRVMLYYVARVMDSGRVDAKERLNEAVEAVEGNRKLLRMMAPLFPVSETFVSTPFAADDTDANTTRPLLSSGGSTRCVAVLENLFLAVLVPQKTSPQSKTLKCHPTSRPP